MRKSITALVLAALVATLVVTPTGNAASSRDDFVNRVDPVCKRTQGTATAFRRGADNRRELGRTLMRIARHGREAIADIYAIGPDPRDLVLFDRWIQKLQLENELATNAGEALQNGGFKLAARYSHDAADADRRAAHIVRSFGFTHCDRPSLGTP